MSHGYRRYGTPGIVVVTYRCDEAIAATPFGHLRIRHARGAPFGVDDHVVIFRDGTADVVPPPTRRSAGVVPGWVRLAVALAAPFRS